MVNFVSMFCPELQKLQKPIYDLTRKGRPFIWEDEQQKAFVEIKSRLQKPPVLSMPDKRGRFILYSDTSKLPTDGTLYQVQVDHLTITQIMKSKMAPATNRIKKITGNIELLFL